MGSLTRWVVLVPLLSVALKWPDEKFKVF